MPDEKKEDGTWDKVIVGVVGVVVALLAGSTAPWWWQSIVGTQPSPTPPAITSPSATTSPSSAPDWLRENTEIALKTETGWLDGRTESATVGLAPSIENPYSGTRWQVHVVDDRDDLIIQLKTLGEGNGGSRWLDGRTGSATVGLAPSTQNPYSGTRWRVHVVKDGGDRGIKLETLGEVEGPRWLNGMPDPDGVKLTRSQSAPTTLWIVSKPKW